MLRVSGSLMDLIPSRSITPPNSRKWMKPANLVALSLVVLVGNVGFLHRAAFDEHGDMRAVESATNEAVVVTSNLVTKKNEEMNAAPSSTPVASSPSSHQDVSACLLLKDDNDILPEWIAYHFHNVKLRDLIVAVDPTSQTSPRTILLNWNKWTNLSATIWSDNDFMPKHFLEKGYHTPPHEINSNATESKWHLGHEDAATVVADTLQILNHRFRQVTFLKRCLKEFQERGRAWVMHVDTDEFVVVNPLLRNTTQKNVEMIQVPTTMKEPGNVISVLNQFLTQKEELQRKINHPCVTMPRLLFGSLEKNTTNKTSAFETLRWRYHTDFDDKDRNAQPKVMIDVAAVPRDDSMFRKPFSIHRPSMRLCRRLDQLKFQQLQRFPITVNHYVGSWERYNGKNDTRRSRWAYERKAVLTTAIRDDDVMDSWLDGFLDSTTPYGRMLLEEQYGHDLV